MKKFIIFFLFLTFSFLFSWAQKRELGIFLGGSYYIGDINPSKHFYPFIKPAAGVLYRYNFNPRLSIKNHFYGGTLYADDSQSKDSVQLQRNLHFKSLILELSSQLEFNFLPFQIGNPKYSASPYIFAGLSAFYFNPKAELNGTWHKLRPLGTEGQDLAGGGDKKYLPVQVGIPFGVGFKVSIAKRIGLSAEWGLRKTFTDYLDDVSTIYPDPAALAEQNGQIASELSDRSIKQDNATSNTGKQRGNSKNKDWYSFAGITLTYTLKDKPPKCPAYQDYP